MRWPSSSSASLPHIGMRNGTCACETGWRCHLESEGLIVDDEWYEMVNMQDCRELPDCKNTGGL